MAESRKIKVAHVITRMDWGGSPDIVRILCERLDPDQYETSLIIGFTQSPSAKTSEFLKRLRDRITVIPSLRRSISPFYDIIAFLKLYNVFKHNQFDIVHTHTAKAGALGRLAARIAGVPMIIHTPHGHNFYGYFNRAVSAIIVVIEKFLSLFCDKIIALTELERNDCLRYGVCREKKVAFVRMGLELNAFTRSEIARQAARHSVLVREDEMLIGYVGRLESVKGVRYFIEAARLAIQKREKIKFILVGEGSQRQGLEEKVKGLNLQEKIIFTGWKDNIPEVMAGLDVLVLPSLNEAVGIVLIEAQALGVPVIASNVGGIPETIQSEKTGILVAPGDAPAISEALFKILDDPQRLLAMSLAAVAWARDNFRAETMVKETDKIYKDLLNEKHGIA